MLSVFHSRSTLSTNPSQLRLKRTSVGDTAGITQSSGCGNSVHHCSRTDTCRRSPGRGEIGGDRCDAVSFALGGGVAAAGGAADGGAPTPFPASMMMRWISARLISASSKILRHGVSLRVYELEEIRTVQRATGTRRQTPAESEVQPRGVGWARSAQNMREKDRRARTRMLASRDARCGCGMPVALESGAHGRLFRGCRASWASRMSSASGEVPDDRAAAMTRPSSSAGASASAGAADGGVSRARSVVEPACSSPAIGCASTSIPPIFAHRRRRCRRCRRPVHRGACT
jgi:hypothetical protein